MPFISRRHPSRSGAIVAALVVMCGILGSSVPLRAAAPEPSPLPPRWELRFEVTDDLRLLEIGGELYWFMTYLVTNRTDENQIFAPRALLYGDNGELLVAGEDVDFAVTEAILDLLDDPLLESNTEIIGPLLQGKENAREGLWVWQAGDFDLDEINLFVAGLSSETQTVVNPYTGAESVVRKTLHRRYDVPGNPIYRLEDPVRFVEEQWIMR